MSNLIGKSWDDFSLADPDYKEDDGELISRDYMNHRI